MTVRQITPYLVFNGDAGDAMKRYESASGAKIQHAMRYSDVPEGRTTSGGNCYVCLDFSDPACEIER